MRSVSLIPKCLLCDQSHYCMNCINLILEADYFPNHLLMLSVMRDYETKFLVENRKKMVILNTRRFHDLRQH